MKKNKKSLRHHIKENGKSAYAIFTRMNLHFTILTCAKYLFACEFVQPCMQTRSQFGNKETKSY